MMRTFLLSAIITVLFGGTLTAAAGESYYCKYCGEKFQDAASTRLGYCV